MKYVYECDLCGKQFDNDDDAMTCERAHIKVTSAVYKDDDGSILQEYDKGNIFPNTIVAGTEEYNWNEGKSIAHYAIYKLVKENKEYTKLRQDKLDEERRISKLADKQMEVDKNELIRILSESGVELTGYQSYYSLQNKYKETFGDLFDCKTKRGEYDEEVKTDDNDTTL